MTKITLEDAGRHLEKCYNFLDFLIRRWGETKIPKTTRYGLEDWSVDNYGYVCLHYAVDDDSRYGTGERRIEFKLDNVIGEILSQGTKKEGE